MSYKYEKQPNGTTDLVISGFEEGIADSPFEGIGNIRNLSVRYYKGVAYVNYKRKACTITGTAMTLPKFACQSPAGIIYISDSGDRIYKQTAVNGSTFAQLTGATYGGSQGLAFWNNYLFALSFGGLEVCGDGTGDAGVTSSNWDTPAGTSGVWPINNATITLTGTPSAGDTSATLSTYTDAKGNARAFWNGPSGAYICYTGANRTGEQILATLTQGSTAITWTPAVTSNFPASTLYVFPFGTTLDSQFLVSRNDGNLYWCNDSNIASLSVPAFAIFTKGNMKTFTFNSAALSLPATEHSSYLAELRNLLIVATAYSLYPWDRFSPQWQNPVPMLEQNKGMINILNNLYIIAGNKGNIYISNGYNAQRFKKLPDNIAGVIDPAWNWGGVMSHRQNLWLQALAINGQTNAPILAGIFSLDLDTGVLNMEAQNSFGLVAATTTSPGILIDNPSIAVNYDNYYSAWASGAASAGGIDYNDTTLWSNNEPLIETDIIPIGTSVQPKTYSSMEFKLDQPMQSGDSITVYARKSLSDSYVQVGTTSTAVLSAFYPSVSFQSWQWIQLKVTMSCNSASTASSFNQLREIRLR